MKIFEHLEGLASSDVGITKTVLSIIKLETRLAGLTVYPLIINICMVLIVLMTIWVSLMCLIGFFISHAFESPLIALSSVLGLNVFLLIILLFYLNYNLKNMSFEKSRAYFSAIGKDEHDKLSEKSDSPNRQDGRRIKRSRR